MLARGSFAAAVLLLVSACDEKPEESTPIAETQAVVGTETEKQSAETPSVEAAAVTSTSVPLSVPSPLGDPRAEAIGEILLKEWVKDGGALASTSPEPGHRFLRVAFPETRSRTEDITYMSSEFSLQLEGSGVRVSPYAVTPGGGFEELGERSGQPVFQKDVFMTTYRPATNREFAVVFAVPQSEHGAILHIKDVALPLRW